MNLDDLGGRKLIMAIVVLAIGLAIVFIKGDVPGNFSTLLQVLFGAFVAGNVGEHAANAYAAPEVITKEDVAEPSQENPFMVKNELDFITSRLAIIEDTVTKNAEATANVQAALSLIISKYGIDKQ